MATTNALKDMQDSITCAVCLLPQTDPKSLQCLHSYCFHCLQKIYLKSTDEASAKSNTITCPTCRAETLVTDEELSNLPDDFRVKQVQDFLKSMQMMNEQTPVNSQDATEALTPKFESVTCRDDTTSQRLISCEVCLKKGQIVDPCCFCFDYCTRPMCYQCSSNHDKTIHFKGHVTCEVEHAKLHLLKCTQHDEYIQAFCGDCWVPVCNDCIVTTHNNHAINTPLVAPDADDPTISMIKQCGSALDQDTFALDELEKQQSNHIEAVTEALSQQKMDMLKQIDDEEQKMKIEIQKNHDKFSQYAARFRTHTQQNRTTIDKLLVEAFTELRPFSFTDEVMLCNHQDIAGDISSRLPSDRMPFPKMQNIRFVKHDNTDHFLGQIATEEQIDCNPELLQGSRFNQKKSARGTQQDTPRRADNIDMDYKPFQTPRFNQWRSEQGTQQDTRGLFDHSDSPKQRKPKGSRKSKKSNPQAKEPGTQQQWYGYGEPIND